MVEEVILIPGTRAYLKLSCLSADREFEIWNFKKYPIRK
jgi:hypothetical protein